MQTKEIFVSLDGLDTNDGSITSPLRTVKAAQKLAISIPKETTQVKITIRGGNYYEESPIRITLVDSGSEKYPVIYSAYEGETVSFIGGIKLDKSRFSKVTDEKIFSKVIDENARKRLTRIDLSDRKNDLYRIRPNRDKSYMTTALFCDDCIMEPARYPKRNPDKKYCGGKYVYTKGFSSENGVNPVDIIINQSESERISKWDKETLNDVWVNGYFTTSFSDDSHRIAKYDLENNRITCNDIPFIYGSKGNLNKEKSAPYYFYNVFDEISYDDEYYIDYDNGYVYICPSERTENADYYLGTANEPMLDFAGTMNITVKNINFLCTHSDISRFTSSKNITIDGCKMAHASGIAAIMVDTYDTKFVNCDIYDTCRGGIKIDHCGEGYHRRMANIRVENCIMHDVARTILCYTSCVRIGYFSCGVKITGCTMYNSPHNLIDAGPVQNVEISNCEFYNAASDTDDASVIYWGRNPATLGFIIHDNYFHDCQNPNASWDTACIYQDDNGTGADIYNNVFYNVASPTKAAVIKGAQWHNTHNNIFIGENPPEHGNVFGYNSWLKDCSGAHSMQVPSEWNQDNNHVNPWFTQLDEAGFFSEYWTRYYKGTFWEKMYEVLDAERLCKVALYRKSLENEPIDMQNAKLIYFSADLFWSHKLFDGRTYEGSAYDCIKELFPEDYEKAEKEVEGKGEIAWYYRMALLVKEMYWFDKFKADESVFYSGNLTIGMSEDYKKDGKHFDKYLDIRNSYDMTDDKMPNGKSIFVDFGKDFTLTKEGEEFVKSHIEGFTPIDMSKIGAKR